MDPVTALGVASGILSFLTFSTALLKVGHGVCVTSSGRNEQNMTREVVVDETKAFLDRLMPADDPRLADEAGLCRLVEESRRIAKDLMEILLKIKPKKSGTVANLRSAIRHTLSQPDMDDLEKRLDQCRSQLGLHLNLEYFKSSKSSLDHLVEQGDLSAAQLSQLQTSVDRLRRGVVIESLSDEAQDQFRRLLGIQQDSVDRTCQQVILKALRFPEMRGRFDALDPAHKKTFRWLLSDDDDTDSDSDSGSVSLRSRSSTSDVAGLNDAEPGCSGSNSGNELLSSATPQTIFVNVAEEPASASKSLRAEASDHQVGSEAGDSGYSHTASELDDHYEYSEMTMMRKSARDKFLGWLSSCDGIFHICGKLGSGKSTLMKYLFEHKRTRAELEVWAGGSHRLVSASFFFWKPGSKLQKSLPGLYRSLLHDILAACPELIPSTLPTMWERATKHHFHSQSEIDIPPQQISTAFDKLIRDENLYAHHQFCFFIDGLDEYEQTTQQDYKSVVDLFINWTTTSGGNVKLCVSSREYNVFMNAFEDQRRLRVHDLTLLDIRRYVEDRLGHLPDEEATINLARDIAIKAHGIFFWVALVVQSMREAIEDGMAVVSLAELLDSLPTDLEDLFHHILSTLDERKLKKASKTFAMLDIAKNASLRPAGDDFPYPSLTLLAYSFLDHYERDKKFAIRDNFLQTIATGETNLEERMRLATKQLRANCGGLLEPTVIYGKIEDPIGFDYTHRSVPEFLEAVRKGERPGLSLSDPDFDAGDAATSLILAQFRALGALGTVPYYVTYAGLAIFRLAAVATPDQEPYDFLECLDSLSNQANLHDPVEDSGRVWVSLSFDQGASVDHRTFPGDRAVETRLMDPPYKIVKMERPILAAMDCGFNEYVVWKLRNDPGTVDTPAKRMVLAYLAITAEYHPPWDALFETGAISSWELSGFLKNLDCDLGRDVGWDTSGCAWFSSWRQILIHVAFSIAHYEAAPELSLLQDTVSKNFEHAVVQFLRRGVADRSSDLELIVVPTLEPSIKGTTELRIVKLVFRFADGSLISYGNPSGGEIWSRMETGARTDLALLQWCSEISGSDIAPGKEMHITFRQLIQGMGLANQDLVFALLDERDALDIAATAGEVDGPETPEEVTAALPPPLLAEQDLSRTTAGKVTEKTQSLRDRLDTDLALAFGSGVLVSLLVASVWMRYSGMRGQV